MKRPWLKIMPLLLGLLLAWTASSLAQGDGQVNQLLVESYDLIEAGKMDQARAILEKLLKHDPGNPLALNNLGAILVKEKKYPEALKYLEQALPRARGYQAKINRVCAVDGICMAFRPAMEVYGDQELAPLVQFNIEMVKARLATRE